MRGAARLAAFATAVVALGYATLLAGGDSRVLLASGFALFAVVASLGLWSEGALTFSAAGLAGVYAVALEVGDVAADVAVPLLAVLLVAYLEFADLAMSVPSGRRLDRGYARLFLGRLAGSVTLAALVAAAVVGLAFVELPGTTAVRTAGLLAGAAAVGVPVALLVRRPGPPRDRGI